MWTSNEERKIKEERCRSSSPEFCHSPGAWPALKTEARGTEQVPGAPEKAWDEQHKTIQNSEQFKTQPLCRKQTQRDRLPTVCFQVLHENHRLALLNYYEREIKSPPGLCIYLCFLQKAVFLSFVWQSHTAEYAWNRHFWGLLPGLFLSMVLHAGWGSVAFLMKVFFLIVIFSRRGPRVWLRLYW